MAKNRVITCEGLPSTRKEAREKGIEFYYNGPCSRGHLSPRNVRKSECLECKKENDKRLHLANKEKNLERISEWRKNNPEKVKKNSSAYYQRNKNKISENRQELFRKWYYGNHDKAKLIKRVSQANRKNNLIGSFTAKEVEKIRALQKDRCACCGVNLAGGGHIDHIIPVSKGGLNVAKNLQLMCAFCNVSKKDKDPIDFMRQNGRLL